jgi:hypothetical protein
MRRLAILIAVLFVCSASDGLAGVAAAAKIRLAQTSTVTNCMMACNSQAASCQTNCVVPGSPPTGAAVATGNANVSTNCQLSCATLQVNCQTICGRTSPSP